MKQFLSHDMIQDCERTVIDAITQEWLTARVQNEDPNSRSVKRLDQSTFA